MKNNYYNLSHAISQEQCSIWSWFFGTLVLNDISSCCCCFFLFVFFFFSFFWNFHFLGKFLFFGKRAKNGPKWQKILSVTLYISGTIHPMIVIYGVHVSNDNISRLFSIFLKFWFFGLLGSKRAKKWSKIIKKICCTLYFRNHTSYDLYLWYTCMYKRIISQAFFSFFSKFWFLGLLEGVVKGQKMAQNDKKILSFSLCISESVHHMIVNLGTHM